jgi:hypothetical protein
LQGKIVANVGKEVFWMIIVMQGASEIIAYGTAAWVK